MGVLNKLIAKKNDCSEVVLSVPGFVVTFVRSGGHNNSVASSNINIFQVISYQNRAGGGTFTVNQIVFCLKSRTEMLLALPTKTCTPTRVLFAPCDNFKYEEYLRFNHQCDFKIKTCESRISITKVKTDFFMKFSFQAAFLYYAWQEQRAFSPDHEIPYPYIYK